MGALLKLTKGAEQNQIDALVVASQLRAALKGDRRLETLAALIALGPDNAWIDSDAGLDGWDILSGIRRKPEVWMESADVLYASRYVDSALELCEAAAPDAAPELVGKAMLAVMRQHGRLRDGDIGGLIARHITAELMEWKARADVVVLD